ncbi:MAG: neutral/alkaline non-lysosomal ceramidase N-terminal domain-containing protein [Bacteroidota bacterium]
MKNRIKLVVCCGLLFGYGINSFAQNSIQRISSHESLLKGALAQTNITPPIGCRLAGHFYESISTGIHDSLWAKAMVIQQENKKFAFVFCDLIGLTAKISSKARSIAAAKTGIPFANILIAATHSHTGPLFYGFQREYFHNKALAKGKDPHETNDYPEFLVNQIVKALVQANNNILPVSIEVGTTKQEGIAHNRRYHMKNGDVLFNPGPLNPDIVSPAGPVDPALGVLLLRDLKSKKLQGGLTVFGMHADGVGGTEISADYPYYLEQSLKTQFGKKFISAFALGPSGDINHIDVKKDEPIYSSSNPENFGKKIAQAVINKVPGLRPVNKPALTMLSSKIILPLQVPTKDQIDSARAIINALYEEKESGEYVKRAGGEAGDFLKRVEMSKYINLAERKSGVEVEVQVFRIDSETAIVGLPGEIFAELGLAIKKQSPFTNTIVMTVCNDKTSYIPTRKAFTEGSYEVTNSIIKPGGGEMLVETSVKLLNKIKNIH